MGRKIPIISGLRGCAILTIVAYHLFQPMFPPPGPLLWWGDYLILHRTALFNAERAVDLFFILSGFVLALPYFKGVRTMNSFRDIGSFYKHRSRRLLPLYYLNVAIALVFLAGLPKDIWLRLRDLFLIGTFTYHFVPTMWFLPINGVLWSFAAEVWFCVLLPFILLAIRRFGMARTILPIFCVSLTVQYLGLHNVGIGINYISDNVVGRLDDFCAGLLLAYVYAKEWKPLHGALLPIGILAVFTSCILSERARVGLMYPYIFYPLMLELCTVGFLCIILHVLQIRRGFVYSFLSNRFLQMIGMMSYSIYVWHGLVMGSLVRTRNVQQLSYYIIILGIISWVSYRYVEFGHVRDISQILPARNVRKNPVSEVSDNVMALVEHLIPV